MPLKLNTASSGSVTLDAANTASNFTITVPAITATLDIQGSAFSAYQVGTTTLTNGVNTKVLFDTEHFDTNNNFASSRFTPTVAGYYQINANVTFPTAGAGTNLVYIFKNGSEYSRGARQQSAGVEFVGLSLSTVVYLNGSTDYVEIYAFTNGGTATTEAGAPTVFSGALVRAA